MYIYTGFLSFSPILLMNTTIYFQFIVDYFSIIYFCSSQEYVVSMHYLVHFETISML